jgi:FTR1 family protein
MFSALILALREGVEAALVVGIVLVYLHRTGRAGLAHAVWTGLAAALAASVFGAILLEQWQINQEGFEGVLMLTAGFFVVTMIWWMRRVARTLKQHIEQRVETYAQRTTLAAAVGLAVFVFLMVLREGVELVLILRAVQLSSEGLRVWMGTVVGLLLAVAVGILFFQGTLRIPLPRFFAATSTILMVVALQLVINGVHELSEAMWIPSSQREMALVGPIVRNDVFFFVVILGIAALVVLREWLALRQSPAPGADANPAQRRRWEWEQRKQRRWMFAAGTACILVVAGLALDFFHTRAAAAPPEAQRIEPRDAAVRIPVSELNGSAVRFYAVEEQGAVVRFLVARKPDGTYSAALDACQICGPAGYRHDGQNLICRNCDAAIYLPSVGDTGGCNPIGVPSRVEGGEVVIALEALTGGSAPAHERK